MARYIDADIAIDAFYEMASDTDHLCTVSDYVKFLESMSDAVEIVRCKDCKHYWKNWKDEEPDWGNGVAVCLCSPKDDAFCSEGERREDEDR